MTTVEEEIKSILNALADDEGYQFGYASCHFCGSCGDHEPDCLIMRAKSLVHNNSLECL